MNIETGTRRVDVGGHRLWTDVRGDGSPALLFESGSGDHSSVWAEIEPRLRERLRTTSFLYDRAGLGESEPSPGPYRIEPEVAALRSALDQRRIPGPIVAIAHSYGGFLSLLLATQDPRVAGLVLLDANIPEFFDEAEVARRLARVEELAENFAREAPDIARTVLPEARALPETARTLRSVEVPVALPIIDIVAERSWIKDADEAEAMRRAHEAFVRASPNRESVFAKGSGHYVMEDRSDLVEESVGRMVERIRSSR